MKRMLHYLSRQILTVRAQTIFPQTRNDVMLSIETEKQEIVFNLHHDQAVSLAWEMMEKAIPNKEDRKRHVQTLVQ